MKRQMVISFGMVIPAYSYASIAANISVTCPSPFQLRRLRISATDIDSFQIRQLTINGRQQLLDVSSIGAEVFDDLEIDARFFDNLELQCEPALPDSDIILRVINTSVTDKVFRAFGIGDVE